MKYLSAIFFFFLACSGADNKDLPEAVLLDTYWKLNNLSGEKVKHPQAQSIHIYFSEEDNNLSGFAGCNQLIGNFALREPDKISMLAASTKMMCPDYMAIEDNFMILLTQVDNYSISGQELSLKIGTEVVAVFLATEKP